jgi:hypothetical protein
VAKTDVERLAKLSRDRAGFLSIHKTLMETYKKTKVSRYKDMAAEALYAAKKRSDRIAAIIKDNNDDDDAD